MSLKREYINYKGNILHTILERYTGVLHDGMLCSNPYLDITILKKYYKTLNWNMLCWDIFLTEEFIETYKEHLNWKCISLNTSLTPYLCEKYFDKLDYYLLTEHNPHCLTESLIERHIDKFYWKTLCCALPIRLLEKYIEIVEWIFVSMNVNLTPDFIERYKDKLYWRYLSGNICLTMPLIQKYIDRVEYDNLSANPNLTEEFIDIAPDKFNWDRLSKFGKWSEQFIERYKDKLDWYRLITYLPDLTDTFIQRYIDRLTKPEIFPLFVIKPCFIRYIKKFKLSHSLWAELSRNPALTLELIEKYKCKLDFREFQGNHFLYNDVVYRKNIEGDMGCRRKLVGDIELCSDIKNYILRYYVGYD